MGTPTLRRSAIVNATIRRTLSIDTGSFGPSSRLDLEHPKSSTDMSTRRDQAPGDNGMNRWDEARVGVPDQEAEKGTYGPSHVVKLGIATIRRRTRRTLLLVISFLSVLAWLSLSSHPFTADVVNLSERVHSGTGMHSDAAENRSFPLRLMDCLSFKHCPWLLDDPTYTRDQLLATDEEYLEPEHLTLPRRDEPYPDIDQWSTEKRERVLHGLEWLITHYNERWRPEPSLKAARRFNQAVFTKLHDCIQTSMTLSKVQSTNRFGAREQLETCTPEEMTVIVLGSYHFGAVHIGWVSGEDIWARSVITTMVDLGHSILYAYDTAEIFDIYRAIPDLVQIIIAQTSNIRECKAHGVHELSKVLTEPEIRQGARIMFVQTQATDGNKVRNHTLAEWKTHEGNGQTVQWMNPVFYGHPRLHGQRTSDSPGALDPNSPNYEPHQEWLCAQAPDFPQGVPLYKMFGFHFWENTDEHPLGGQWTLSPEPYAAFPSLRHKPEHNFYTGYSVESYCGDVVPVKERDHRAYILAKVPEYLEPPRFAFSNHVFNDMKQDFGFHFVAGIGKADSALPDAGITNLGFLSLAEFRRALGYSKVLVGVGRPRLSPTPYDGLCMGLPFINSILDWDEKRPDDQTAWYSQHEGLINVGEPYVYNVKQGNETELKVAIAKAFASPIERFIPRRMTKPAMMARHRLLVEADWKRVYEELFEGEKV